MSEKNGGVVRGCTWMVILSLVLGWIPVVGPLIAGIIGGRAAGGVVAAIAAVFLPAILLGACLFFGGTMLTTLPVVGAVLGVGGAVIATAHVGPLLLGAVIGGLLG